jgi:hypothetical protein
MARLKWASTTNASRPRDNCWTILLDSMWSVSLTHLTCFYRRTAPDILQLRCDVKTHPMTTVMSILQGRRAVALLGRELSKWGGRRWQLFSGPGSRACFRVPCQVACPRVVAFICTCSSARAEQVKSMFVLYAKSRVKKARCLCLEIAER